jgi:hypothetical protein
MDVEPVGSEFEEGWPAVTASPCHSIPGRPGTPPQDPFRDFCRPEYPKPAARAVMEPATVRSIGTLVAYWLFSHTKIHGTRKGQRRADVGNALFSENHPPP